MLLNATFNFISVILQGVLDTTLCDKVCQWLAPGQWFSPGTPVSSANKTEHHDITEILLKVTLNLVRISYNSSILAETSLQKPWTSA
jgi:hypothetical protein